MTAYPALSLIQDHAARFGAAPADPLRQPLDEARSKALAYQSIWNHELPAIVRRQDIQVGSLRLRLFDSQEQGAPRPVLVYFHGGGFALNSIDTHERLLRLLALRSGVAVLAVSYSLAPEVRFPGQISEALAAVAWLRAQGARYGLDPKAWAVGGDSAGANLALALTLALRDQRHALPRLGLLLYGMFSADLDSPSHRAFGGGGFGLTTERVDWFWAQYLADPTQRDNPLAAPLLADLHGLPPQVVIGAGLDCLLDDSLNMAARLEQAGIAHTLIVQDGAPHSFMQMSAVLPQARLAVDQAAQALAQALAPALEIAAE